MAKSQTNSVSPSTGLGLDLLVDVRSLEGRGVRAGLLEALREAIRTGRLAPGSRLPASRALATDLGVARSTVTECYSELVAEGWLTARQGSGTRVATSARPRRPAPGSAQASSLVSAQASSRASEVPAARGLLPGAAEFAEFPRQQWLAASRRALAAAPYSSFGYGDPAGAMELRRALADYLGRVRGVRAEPHRILICSGFHHGLELVATALGTRGARAVAVEGYGLGLYRNLLAESGLRIPPIAVDDSGAETSALAGLDADAVLLTPAHQFPTGSVLSPERRAVARDWARTTNGVILEDDYDGEFRYDRTPVGALQGLDPDRVVYFGTASKSLAPALRMAWVVLPEHLVEGVLGAKGPVETVSVLDQLTLAEFIASGGFDRHVRARRLNYGRRRRQLVEALAVAAPGVRISGIAAGLQAVLELPPGIEREVVRVAAARGLTVSALSEFRHDDLDPAIGQRSGLVVNYSAISDSAWEGALALLCSVMPPSLRL
jgi:GntR family transcriptional regulator/MocR family aminotransferase